MPPEPAKTRFVLPSGLAFLYISISLFQSHFKLLTSGELASHWWSMAAISSRPEVIRLPSILAVGVGLASLWTLLRRHYPQTIATIACLALLCTRAFDYAYDAGPNALILGITLVATSLFGRWLLDRPLSPPTFPARAILLAILLLTAWATVRQARCAMLLRRQRHAFFQLRDNTERATAPGEQVLVSDPLLLPPLRWYASPALREAIVNPDTSLNPQAESVYIGPPSNRFPLTEYTTTVHWNDLAGVYTPVAKTTTRVYFATPNLPSPEIPSRP